MWSTRRREPGAWSPGKRESETVTRAMADSPDDMPMQRFRPRARPVRAIAALCLIAAVASVPARSQSRPATRPAGIDIDTRARSMLVGADSTRQRLLRDGLADLYINIHMRGIGMLEFDAVDPVQELGYEQAGAVVRQWLDDGGLTP